MSTADAANDTTEGESADCQRKGVKRANKAGGWNEKSERAEAGRNSLELFECF